MKFKTLLINNNNNKNNELAPFLQQTHHYKLSLLLFYAYIQNKADTFFKEYKMKINETKKKEANSSFINYFDTINEFVQMYIFLGNKLTLNDYYEQYQSNNDELRKKYF